MVAAVAAKTAWKNQIALLDGSVMKKSPYAKRLITSVVPYAIPQPKAQNINAPTEKSIRFFMMMLAAFLALVKPASTMANPACMNITIAAATTSQI